jgi:hypothetical protein
MSNKYREPVKPTAKALSAAGAAIMCISNPVTLLFILLIVMAYMAVLNEQIILIGMISTLAMLMGAIGAGILAIFFVRFDKTLSPRGFSIFLAFAFVIPLMVWTPEIFNVISDNQWFYVVGLAAIMFACSLHLVPRLLNVYRLKGVMAPVSS